MSSQGETSAIMTSAGFASRLLLRLRRRTSDGAYQAKIDGLRFLAIAIVVVGHLAERLARFFPQAIDAEAPLASALSRPGLGVYLFFSISGFMLASRAMTAKGSLLGADFLRAYFVRRALRIEPPYVILLTATAALLAASGYRPDNVRQFDGEPQSLALSLAASIVYLHDLVWGTFPRLFPPGWSLETEVQFYVSAPLLFFAYFGVRRPAARAACGALVLGAAALVSLLAPDRIGPLHAEFSILRFFHFFWLGIVLADRREAIAALMRGVAPWTAGALGWSALLVYLLLPNAPDASATTGALLLALAFRAVELCAVALIFASVLANGGSFARFCAQPFVALVGGACYSIYLTHIQALQLATGFVARHAPQMGPGGLILIGCGEIVIVAIIGLAFYALVERFFMAPDWPARVAAWPRAAWRRLARERVVIPADQRLV